MGVSGIVTQQAVTVCEGGESGEKTQLHNVWKTGDVLRDIQKQGQTVKGRSTGNQMKAKVQKCKAKMVVSKYTEPSQNQGIQ